MLDQSFARIVSANEKLLYLPMALRGQVSFEDCLKWISQTLIPLGVTNIDMWQDLKSHDARELNAYSAIYMGGGNTYQLLHELKESQFDKHLVAYLLGGGSIYGGSAGAVVLGKTIHTIDHLDKNNIGLKTLNSLDFVNGCSVWVHYNRDDDEKIHELSQLMQTPIIAIPERSGVIVSDQRLTTVGFESSFDFVSGTKVSIPRQNSQSGR